MMICASIQERSFERCIEMISQAKYRGEERIVELRADLCGFSPEQVKALIKANPHTIVTSRVTPGNPQASVNNLSAAIEAGVEYIDTEVEYPSELQRELCSKAHQSGTKVIVSWHHFSATPSLEALVQRYNECRAKGADVVKIVTTARNMTEACRTMQLYRIVAGEKDAPQLTAFAMGAAGKFTRYLALKMGAPFSYTYPDGAEATAPGQFSESALASLMERGEIELPRLEGSISNCIGERKIQIPCSKSESQRTIVAAISAKGKTVLENFEPCNDSQAALNLAEQLGCKVRLAARTLTIESTGAEAIKESLPQRVKLHPGESGLLTRLMLPLACLFADKSGREIEIEGEGSLLTRDITATAEAVEAAGFTCLTTSQKEKSGRFIPCRISGNLTQKESITIDGRASSQIVSGFLMALPLAGREFRLKVTNPTSVPYIELTEDVLKTFGIEAKRERSSAKEILWRIPNEKSYRAAVTSIRSDWSSASYFLVADVIRQNLVGGEPVSFVGLVEKSRQADEAILGILEQCGCTIERQKMKITAPKELKAFRTDATHCPDLFPILAVLALFCNGKSRIKGVGRLSAKESNRAESIFAEFTSLGGDISIVNDYMYICGGKLHGGQVCSYNDHRIAMSAAVAALFTGEPIFINETNCTSKSFPRFFELLGEYLKML